MPIRCLRPARLVVLAALMVVAAAGRTAAWADAVAVVVPADGLRLRAGPSTEHPVLDLIPGGTRLAVTGRAVAGNWYPVVYRGQSGYVLGEFLSFDEAGVAATRKATVTPPDGLNLRAAPSETAEVRAVLTAGTVVTVLGQPTSDGWALVQVNEMSGWVFATYLAILTSSPSPTSGRGVAEGRGEGSLFSAPATPGGGTRVTVRYYHPSFEGERMACGGEYRADDPTIAATNSWPCGTVLRLCRGAACVVVTVRDRGGMAANEVDVSAAAFARLGTLGEGVITATAEVIGP